jgi:tetratricopeptide (TPR) repeat protein
MLGLLSRVCVVALLVLSARSARADTAAGVEPSVEVSATAATAPRVATSPQAHARAARITKTAQEHYNAERYEEAAAAYQRAYAVVPAPELLFNLGQCQRLLARPRLALKYFEAYLRLRPDSPQRVLVEQLIAEAKALPIEEPAPAVAGAQTAPSAPAVPPVQRIVVAGLMPLPEHETHGPRLLADERYADHESTQLYERWWFWTAIAAVAAGAAVTTYVLLQDGESEAPSGTLGTIEWD